jgi:hypothetical protein
VSSSLPPNLNTKSWCLQLLLVWKLRINSMHPLNTISTRLPIPTFSMHWIEAQDMHADIVDNYLHSPWAKVTGKRSLCSNVSMFRAPKQGIKTINLQHSSKGPKTARIEQCVLACKMSGKKASRTISNPANQHHSTSN